MASTSSSPPSSPSVHTVFQTATIVLTMAVSMASDAAPQQMVLVQSVARLCCPFPPLPPPALWRLCGPVTGRALWLMFSLVVTETQRKQNRAIRESREPLRAAEDWSCLFPTPTSREVGTAGLGAYDSLRARMFCRVSDCRWRNRVLRPLGGHILRMWVCEL